VQYAPARASAFPEYREALRRSIDAELEAQLTEWFPGLPEPHLAALRGVLAHGKRLRGCIACLVAEALGARAERAMPAALAIELIQAASLVHDDFVDGDALRRGRPAAWTLLSPRRAVLLADVMFATAIERMAQAGGAEAATLAHAIATMARGAFQELLEPLPAAQESASGAPAAYRRIIQLKTGALFAASARLGALAAGAAPRQLEAAHEFGARTGEVYQVADDLADVAALCSGAQPDWQRISPLIPAVVYFAGAPGVPRGTRDEQALRAWLRAAAPRVLQRMNHEIALLIEQARATLAPFPDNERTRLLGEAPAEFVRAMAPA
jgi:geranylgeranyl pyrophosphate synthase